MMIFWRLDYRRACPCNQNQFVQPNGLQVVLVMLQLNPLLLGLATNWVQMRPSNRSCIESDSTSRFWVPYPYLDAIFGSRVCDVLVWPHTHRWPNLHSHNARNCTHAYFIEAHSTCTIRKMACITSMVFIGEKFSCMGGLSYRVNRSTFHNTHNGVYHEHGLFRNAMSLWTGRQAFPQAQCPTPGLMHILREYLGLD